MPKHVGFTSLTDRINHTSQFVGQVLGDQLRTEAPVPVERDLLVNILMNQMAIMKHLAEQTPHEEDV